MRRLEEAGLTAATRVLGPRRAQRAADIYSDAVLPRAESISYRLSSHGRASERRLAELAGRHRGKQCFILGNGPSINSTDLSLLRNQFVFALNRGYLLFDRLGQPATFLVAVNRHVTEQFGAELAAAGSQLFAGWHSRHHFPNPGQVTFIRRARRNSFSTDLVQGAWEGPTVTYLALQLAYHMGFGEVVLLGVDHSFTTRGTPSLLVTSQEPDANHFDPTYFGPGVRWQLPDLDESERVYRRAKQAFADDGRRIFDATIGGMLTVFPKRDLVRVVPKASGT